MPQITLNSIQQLKEMVGREVVVSDWLNVTQEQINLFAEATCDHQWIHVDQARAAKESPYKTTIAHGFLTLSVLVHLLNESIIFSSVRMGVNYGLNRVRFPEVVPANARVRARFALQGMEEIPDDGAQIVWVVTMERDGAEKPCLVAEWVTRCYE